jgi:hypothetical protein
MKPESLMMTHGYVPEWSEQKHSNGLARMVWM